MISIVDKIAISVVDEDEIDTVLGPDIDFEGEIETDRSLMIKGRVSGTIRSSAEVYISDGARVDADIYASQVTVRGKLKGNIEAVKAIQILENGKVEGKLSAPEIVIEHESGFLGERIVLEDKIDEA